jgi:4-oxalocrotonate tautomerase
VAANAAHVVRVSNRAHLLPSMPSMPYVNVKITKGNVTKEQKSALVRDITDSLVKHLGKDPDHIHIVIDEIEPENWGYSGMLTTEYRQRQKDKTSDVQLTPEYVMPRVLKSSPKTKVSLHHFISAIYQFDATVTKADIDQLIARLQKEKKLSIDAAGKVTYKNG